MARLGSINDRALAAFNSAASSSKPPPGRSSELLASICLQKSAQTYRRRQRKRGLREEQRVSRPVPCPQRKVAQFWKALLRVHWLSVPSWSPELRYPSPMHYGRLGRLQAMDSRILSKASLNVKLWEWMTLSPATAPSAFQDKTCRDGGRRPLWFPGASQPSLPFSALQ